MPADAARRLPARVHLILDGWNARCPAAGRLVRISAGHRTASCRLAYVSIGAEASTFEAGPCRSRRYGGPGGRPCDRIGRATSRRSRSSIRAPSASFVHDCQMTRVLAVVLLLAGCGKSEPAAPPTAIPISNRTPPPPDPGLPAGWSIMQPIDTTSLYPDSMAVDATGQLWIGMRHYVVRLTPAGARYTVAWLARGPCV
jgi:hypothetical protein